MYVNFNIYIYTYILKIENFNIYIKITTNVPL